MGEPKKVRGIIIDPETGELVGELHDGDRVVRKASVEYLRNSQVWRMENFYKGHTGELGRWMRELSANEKVLLFSVVPYIGYEDCCLKHSNGVPLGTEDLVKISGMARSTMYETLSGLIKKDIIYRGKNANERQFFINPWLFAKGNRINRVLKTMFRNYRVRVLGGVKWSDFPDAE